jgi:pyruvate formate lyase activating enzyme
MDPDSSHYFGLSRREFLQLLAGAGCALALGSCRRAQSNEALLAANSPTPARAGHPARFWRDAGAGVVECQLCPRGCTINTNSVGFCRGRRNVSGKLTSLVYGQPVTVNNDPIEKKPFNHVLPGTTAFSLACVGCNMTCRHCQNWQISQASPGDLPAMNWTPADVVRRAKESGAATIAFTYNEPTIWSEYVLDTALAGKAQGMRTILISNGFIQEHPQRELARALLAYKVDLKGFSERFYRDICDAHLQPVLDGMLRIKQEKTWLEIVTLIIPTLNDDPQELKQLAAWVRDNLGPDVPLHFTRFMPLYRLRNLPRTPVPTLETARQIALDAGLHFVYVGNVPGHPGENTYCPKCRTTLIQRYGMSSTILALQNGKCAKCGQVIPGVWA